MTEAPEGYGGAENGDFGAGGLTNLFSDLAQNFGDLLPPGRYPVKGLFGAAPQIARNSGAHPRPILKPKAAIALLNMCARLAGFW